MSLLIVSRTESRLKEQAELITKTYSVPCKYLAYDFTKLGPEKKEFYAKLDVVNKELTKDGGIGEFLSYCVCRQSKVSAFSRLSLLILVYLHSGLLINNVGTANEIPKGLDEMDEDEIEGEW